MINNLLNIQFMEPPLPFNGNSFKIPYTNIINPVLSFKSQFSLEKRIEDSSNVLKKHPDRIPVIIEKYYKSSLQDINRKKYLVPNDMTVGQLMYVIRKSIKLHENKAIFIFINNITPPTSLLISTLYKNNKDEDNFMYVLYDEESVFG